KAAQSSGSPVQHCTRPINGKTEQPPRPRLRGFEHLNRMQRHSHEPTRFPRLAVLGRHIRRRDAGDLSRHVTWPAAALLGASDLLHRGKPSSSIARAKGLYRLVGNLVAGIRVTMDWQIAAARAAQF